MSEWCQNKRCPEKKNQNQIRRSKGNKYYQSNKAGSYGYKSAAPRARKALMEASKELRDVRAEVQETKKSHDEK